MSPIQKVIVLGGTGNLGQIILPALLRAKFTVTLITRPGSSSVAQEPDITTIHAAYDDLPALTSAFSGNDALIIITHPAATVHTRVIVRAALAAGIKHLLTNEFGMNTFHPGVESLPTMEMKITAQKVLEDELASPQHKGASLTWTGLFTGVWFDFCIRNGVFWVDRRFRTVTKFGSGNQYVSLSPIDINGDAVVAVLEAPEKFRNRPAYFARHRVSTNELIKILYDIATEQGEEPWKVVNEANVEKLMQLGLQLWEEDTLSQVKDRLQSKAWVMINTAAMFDEENKWGMDFGDMSEKGWEESDGKLREQLRDLIQEAVEY